MKPENFILSLKVWQYNALEIMTIFDNDGIERRARTFYQGYALYKKKGLDHLDYVDFHIERTNWSRRVLISMTGVFILTGLIFLFHGLWILGIPLISIPIILIFLFENRKVRKNRLLMLDVLSTERTRRRFFHARDSEIPKLFLDPVMVDIDNPGGFLALNSCISIDSELMEIARCENKFNKMPMQEVLEIFSLMCRSEVKRDCPQIAKSDLVNYLRIAFLKKVDAGEKKKISFLSKTNENTRGLFYFFYFQSKQKGFLLKGQSRDDYIRLLTDNFLGFNYDQVSRNFREKRVGKSFSKLVDQKVCYNSGYQR